MTALLSLSLLMAGPRPAVGATDRPPALDPDRAAPGRDSENLESREVREYFRRWLDESVDSRRYREMWQAAQSVPAEATPISGQAVNAWQLIGPLYSANPGGGYMTGRVRDIDPHNVRVLAATGGLWRFHLGAIAMSDSVPASWFGSFASPPSDPNTILLGTGEHWVGEMGTGLYKTTDGGVTWVHKPMSPEPPAFTRIRYSPDGAVVHAASSYGYFRSLDGGETWTHEMVGNVTDLCTVNDDPSLVYAMTSNGGLQRSVDGGASWSAITTGGIPSGSAVGDGAVAALRPLPGGPVWIYVAFNTSVWRSIDSGVSWTNVTPPYSYGVSGYGPVITVCPTDPYTVLMGNVGCHRSIDGGDTWAKIVVADLHADYHVFAWDDNGLGVWAGNDGGWSHSTDRGLNWDSSANVMPVSQFYTVDCEKTDVGTMLGGTQDNSILVTLNQALFWSDPSIGSSEGDGSGVCIDQYNPTHMWAVSGLASGPFNFPRSRSLDGGVTWRVVDNGMDPGPNAGAIRTDNAYPVELFTAMGKTVYESADGADNWFKSNLTEFPSTIRNLTVSTRVAGGAVLYANLYGATSGQRLFVRDGGVWTERSAGLPDGVSVVKVVPHPWAAYADEAWAILSGAGASWIYHTTNRGISWTDVTGDFPPGLPISDLVVYPWNTSQLFVGTFLGCYSSHNGGVNWARWTNGMPPTAIVNEMAYIDLTNTTGEFFVVAATYGRSVWKRNIAGDDPMPTVSIGPASRGEGDAGMTSLLYPVTLSFPAPMAVLVDYSTSNGTATAGIDYVAGSGTVVIPPGQTKGWIRVAVIGDTDREGEETVTTTLSNPIRATLSVASATGTILDDDETPLVQRGGSVTNGTVFALARSGNTLYLGGNFTRVGTACGGGMPFDATSAQPGGMPAVSGYVYAVVPDGSGGWYVGGAFTRVGGAVRSGLAHVLADGSVAAWDPNPDGPVFALAIGGGKVYAGGAFTFLDGTARKGLAAIDATSGEPTSWDPSVDGIVDALALSGSTLYLGGTFTTIDGESRRNAAAVNVSTTSVTSWNPSPDDAIGTFAVAGGTVYAGGSFNTIGAQTRHNIAALNTTTGTATAWNPNANSYVFALAVSGSTVYASGDFTVIGGQSRNHIAALDAGGIATAWAPEADYDVLSLAVSGSTVYAGGYFTTIGGQSRPNAAALDVASGTATSWNPDFDGTVQAIAVNGPTVFLGGSLTMLHPQTRRSLAALDATTGALLPWDPGAKNTVFALAAANGVVYAGGSFDSIGGQPRSRLAAIDSATAQVTSWSPSANSNVRALVATSSTLFAGGQFTTMGAVTRNRVAAFDRATGTLLSWNPNANNTVFALAAQGSGIYAGGAFSSIGGQPRAGLASLSGSTGAASPWNPSPNGPVYALLADGSVVYVGGEFSSIAGVARGCGAVLSSAAIGNWNPATNGPILSLALNGSSEIYVGGDFDQAGGKPRSDLALFRISNSTVSPGWAPGPNNTVYALASSGSVLHAGGAFSTAAGLPQAHVATFVQSSLLDVPRAIPLEPLSLAVSPNPTRASVRFEYALPQAERVRLDVFDVQGRRVAPVVDEAQNAGPHRVTWNGARERQVAAPGLYFAKLRVGDRSTLARFVIVR